MVDTDEEDILLGQSSVTCVNSSDEAVTTTYETDTLAVQSNTILRVRIQAGEEAYSPYKFTFRVATDEGNNWEKDVKMIVEEV